MVREKHPPKRRSKKNVTPDSTAMVIPNGVISNTPKEKLQQPEPLSDTGSALNCVMEYIQSANPDKDWPVIREWLSKQPKTVDEIMDMMAEQPDMAILAHRLARFAKREYEKFEREWKDKTSILREQARRYWEERKAAGMRKQITNDMVEDWIIDNFPDTWDEMSTKLTDMKNAYDMISKAADQVESRAADFRRMLDKQYRTGKSAAKWAEPKTRSDHK